MKAKKFAPKKLAKTKKFGAENLARRRAEWLQDYSGEQRMASKYLHELKPGNKGKVVKVGGEIMQRRLLDMGLVPGSEIEVERVAPLGDLIEIKLKGYHLSLRKQEAMNVLLEI